MEYPSKGQCNQSLSGYIKDLHTSQGIPMGAVSYQNKKKYVNTDKNGFFEIRDLCPSIIDIEISHLSYQDTTFSIDLSKTSYIEIYVHESYLFLKELYIKDEYFSHQNISNAKSIIKLNKEFFKNTSSQNFIESLDKLVGINTMRTGIGISKPIIRGMGNNRVLIHDLGVKQEEHQWGSDHGVMIDKNRVERVEVIKGAASLRYGSDAIGGTIHILPPLLPKENTWETSVLNGYQSNNNLYVFSLKTQGREKNKNFRVVYTHQRFGDYQVPSDQFTYNGFLINIPENKLKNTAGEENHLELGLGWHGKKHAFHVTYTHFSQQVGLFPGAIGIPTQISLSQDGDRNITIPQQDNQHLKFVVKHFLQFRNFFIENTLSYQNNTRKELSYPHLHNRINATSHLALQLGLQTITLSSNGTHFISKNMETTYGFSYSQQQNKRDGFEFLVNDYKNHSLGIFSLAEWSLQKYLILNGGVRLDYFTFHSPAYNSPSIALQTTPQIDLDDSNVSFGVGLSYLFKNMLNFKLNLNQSFRFPTIAELGANGIHHGTFRHEKGDKNLRSERGYQTEIITNYDYKSHKIEMSVFYNYFLNYIYLSPSNVFSSLPEGGQLYQYRQDRAYFMGIEWSYQFLIHRQWKISLQVDYVYNQNLRTQLPLPFTPAMRIQNSIDFTIKKDENKKWALWNLQLHNKWVATQNRVDRNEKETPGYFLMQLSSQWVMNFKKQKLSFFVDVENLTNVRYLNHLSRYRLLNMYEPARNVTIRLIWDFVLEKSK